MREIKNMKHFETDLTCVKEKQQSDDKHDELHLSGLILLVLKSVAEGGKSYLELWKNWGGGWQKVIASLMDVVFIRAKASHRMYKLRKRFIHL